MTFSSLLSIRSHPVRVRGLKRVKAAEETKKTEVAPHAGAWIETISEALAFHAIGGRTPCGCVD